MKKTLLSAAIVTGTAIAAPSAHAALASDAVLLIGPETGECQYDTNGTYPNCAYNDNVLTSSRFTMDNGDTFTALSAGTDSGVTLGAAQTSGEIDTAWDFFNALGNHFHSGVSVATASGDSATIDMSSWMVDWNGGSIPMGAGADAVVTCDAGSGCATGAGYELTYSAIVPAAGGQFEGAPYALTLVGTIGAPSAIPVPAAVWLFGSGLLGLVGVARRRA